MFEPDFGPEPIPMPRPKPKPKEPEPPREPKKRGRPRDESLKRTPGGRGIKPGMQSVNFMVPIELWNDVKRIAIREGRTLAETAILALQEYVERN